MEKILFGLQIGLLIALVAYAIAIVLGKRKISVQPSLLIIAALIVFIYQVPFSNPQGMDNAVSISLFSLIKIIGAGMLAALLLSFIVVRLTEIYSDITHKYVSQNLVSRIKQIIYSAAILGPLLILLLAPYQATIIVYGILKNSILVMLGLWGALKIFWSKTKNDEIH